MSETNKGQVCRKNIRMGIESSLWKYTPNTYSRLANRIAYDFNLCPDTVKYSYLTLFIDNEILYYNHDNLLELTSKGNGLQTNQDGLTDEEVTQELAEENEERNKLGKSPVSLEEWKKKRSPRMKPLEGKG